MKYFKRLNVYKNHNGMNTFNPETLEAHSYGWWCYLKTIKGKLVFNNFFYSPATCKHQTNLKRLLRDLNIRPDLYIEAPEGLSDLPSAEHHYLVEIKNLEAEMKKPRTHKAKNLERAEKIKELKETLQTIKKLQK